MAAGTGGGKNKKIKEAQTQYQTRQEKKQPDQREHFKRLIHGIRPDDSSHLIDDKMEDPLVQSGFSSGQVGVDRH